MRILIAGYSNIVQKRVLPALCKILDITHIDIASRSRADTIVMGDTPVARIYNDYDRAFSESKADIVYVSTVNSAHLPLVQKALHKGMHVIVDKPAFISLEDAKRWTDFARTARLCLAESTVYAYHEQIHSIRSAFRSAQSLPSRVIATFSFPPMAEDNFRYCRELGGGALLDLGPYAVSVGRIFFDNEEPKEIWARVCARGGADDIDISFIVLAVYSQGRLMIGQFGFDTEYRNHVNIIGPGISVCVQRIFSTPPDMENEIHIQQNNKGRVIAVPASDNFLIFLTRLIDAIKAGDYEAFSRDLLADASALHRLRASALEDGVCR